MNTPSFKKERGAILVTAMLLLLILTIIGVSASQMTRMQERMAGNLRDQNLSFQGSEAGLRDGETLIRTRAALPDTCVEAPCLFWTRGTFENVPAEDQEWWDDNGIEVESDGDRTTVTHEMAELNADPRFVVESIGFVPDDLVPGFGPQEGRDFYQVTGRSTGGSGAALTVLRSTYARRF
jgi:type IV pilus assembly protein PilX